MSDHTPRTVDDADSELDGPEPGSGGVDLLTPSAGAIAGFTFAVFSMTGQGTWSLATQSLLVGDNFPQTDYPHLLVGWCVVTLLLAVVGAALAAPAVRHPETGHTWAGHLARAAVLVAAGSALFSLIGVGGGILNS